MFKKNRGIKLIFKKNFFKDKREREVFKVNIEEIMKISIEMK